MGEKFHDVRKNKQILHCQFRDCHGPLDKAVYYFTIIPEYALIVNTMLFMRVGVQSLMVYPPPRGFSLLITGCITPVP